MTEFSIFLDLPEALMGSDCSALEQKPGGLIRVSQLN